MNRQYHLSIIYNTIRIRIKKYNRLKKKSSLLSKGNISYGKFNNAIANCCYVMKREIGFKKRCEVIQLVKYIPKIMKMILMSKLKMNAKAWIDKVIIIQRHIRGFTTKKSYRKIENGIALICKGYKRHYYKKRYSKAMFIQQNWRRKYIKIY